MNKRPIHRIFSFALAIAVSLSMLMAPLSHLDGLDSGALTLGQLDQTEALSDHGHDHHDHDHHDNHHTDHSHGHNPGDHSHDLPVPLNLRGDMQTPIGNLWASVTPRSHDQGQLFGLDRPPRT